MRLIDAEAFRRELINRQITTQFFNQRERHEIGCIVEMLDNAPTVDIKTEVSREIFEEIKQGLDELSNAYLEKSDYSGVVHTIQARSIVTSLENKYTKE